MTGREDVFQQAMNRGHSAAWDQDWEGAASCYREALAEFPDQPQALASLGLALSEMEKYEESLQVYARASEYAPDDPALFDRVSLLSARTENREFLASASMRAAELYLQQQEFDKAIENLSRVAKIDPENLEAHSRLAVIYDRLGKRQQAVAEYMAVASLFQRNEDLDRAFQAIDRALSISPDSREVQEALIMLRDSHLLPRPSRSRAATGPLSALPASKLENETVVVENPGVDPVIEGRDRAFSELAALAFEEANGEGGTDPKKRPGRRFQKIGTGWLGNGQKHNRPGVLLHLSQAVDLQARSQPAEAGEALEQVLAAGMENAAIFYGLGYLFSEAGQLDKAEHYLKIAAGYDDFDLAARLTLGQVYVQIGRLDEGALEYLEALKLADSQVVPENQAETLRRMYGPVIEAEARREDPQAKAQLCDSIARLLRRGDWREQLAKARKELPAGEASGTPAPLGEVLAEARSSQVIESIAAINSLARAGHLRSAMEEALFALLHAPTFLPLHILVGEILMQGDHIPEAVEKFRVVAQTYASRGDSDRAIDLLRRVIRIAPMDVDARNRLIELQLARGDVDDAVQEHIGVADVYYAMADLDRARETYHRALGLVRDKAQSAEIKLAILHQVADIELQRLDWRKALLLYEQIRELDSGDQRARTNLVQLNLRLGQGTQAMAELKNYLSYLYKQGREDLATSFIEELARENPEYPSLQRLQEELEGQAGRTPRVGGS
jgi:tetratricopeptide (TPR) repeat protein